MNDARHLDLRAGLFARRMFSRTLWEPATPLAPPHRSRNVHVHACDNESMRTTIEIKPEHRARLLELAAHRGEKGFSTVVAEALELYLEAESGRTKAIRSALALKGSMRDAEAAGLLTRTGKIRANWR